MHGIYLFLLTFRLLKKKKKKKELTNILLGRHCGRRRLLQTTDLETGLCVDTVDDGHILDSVLKRRREGLLVLDRVHKRLPHVRVRRRALQMTRAKLRFFASLTGLVVGDLDRVRDARHLYYFFNIYREPPSVFYKAVGQFKSAILALDREVQSETKQASVQVGVHLAVDKLFAFH